jgi:hypothetical protein
MYQGGLLRALVGVNTTTRTASTSTGTTPNSVSDDRPEQERAREQIRAFHNARVRRKLHALWAAGGRRLP